MTLCRHQQNALLFGVLVVRITLRHSKQPVKGAFELAADGPIVEGRGQYHNVRLPVSGVDLVHAVPLDAGVLRVLSAAKAALAAVDVHAVQEELGYGAAGALRSLCVHQSRTSERLSGW